MSKLKNRKSNRKSYGDNLVSLKNTPRVSTTFNHPRNTFQGNIEPKQLQLKQHQSPFKMIIKQDANGKYYRDKSKEEIVTTTRNTIVSPRGFQKC